MKLLTVFCWDDIPQLLLQAETVKRFWKGKKHWTIIVEDAEEELSKAAANQIKDNLTDWNIEVIIPDSRLMAAGWRRQQLFKLWYSSISDTEWVLILDCKNLFIRPVSKESFIKNNTVMSVPVFSQNEFTTQCHLDAKTLLQLTEDIPMSSCLTPCVVNSKETSLLIAHLGLDLHTWVSGQATEFALYQCWTYNKFEYEPIQFVTGFWDEVQGPLAYDIALEAINNPQFLVWVHHRYVTKKRYRKLTEKVLCNVGIPQDEIILWDSRCADLLSRYASQDRTNWKNL